MITLPRPILESVERVLEAKVESFTPVSGGCINHGGLLQMSGKKYFLKWNTTDGLPAMFEAESKGLKIISTTKSIRVPDVILTNKVENYQYLILDFISSVSPSKNYWQTFGAQLALLHKNTSPQFGLDHNNYIGALPQSNTPTGQWINFFIENRLSPQVKGARDSGYVTDEFVHSIDKFYKQLPSLLVEEKPSLVHGDLWSGNVMVDNEGLPCLIDPALYYGNREADLAMTYLFGGFDYHYLEAYEDNFALVPGYFERFSIYNLYPLLVHVNLFGKSYLQQVVSILDKFV